MASKDSPCASRDFPEIARIILEERDKGPKDWERNKWAKANKHLVCATCKENNVECIPLDSRIYCNSLVCKKSDRLCSKFNDELYDRIAKRVPTLERTASDDVMSPQRTTEYTGLSFKIPARRPSSTSPAKRTQNSTSSDESQSVSTKTGDIHPNSGIQTLSQKFADKSRENDELQVELKKLKADSEKQKVETEAEIQKLKADLDTTKAALIAANERAEQEENLRREMMQNVTPQEQIDALKRDLEDSRRQLLVKQQIQDQLKNKIQSLQRESSRTTIPIEKHRSKVNALRRQIESERTARIRLDLGELYHTKSERVCLAEAVADCEPQSEDSVNHLVSAVRSHLKELDEVVKRKVASVPLSYDKLTEIMNGGRMVKQEMEDSREMDSSEDRDEEMSVPSDSLPPKKRRKLARD